MKTTRQKVGQWGESLAAKYLREHGFTILTQNWRHGHGELDIIAEKDQMLTFVEVRTRRNEKFGVGEESISHSKRLKLIETAQAYVQLHLPLAAEVKWQIDVIVVKLHANNAIESLAHYPAAISA